MPEPSGPEDKRVAIEARGIVKEFGEGPSALRALDDVSISIRENEFFTLLGPSGCGKTTLLRMIAGFEYPTEGAILLHGEDIAGLPPFKRPVNTVFQSYALFPHLTVEENVAFGLEMLGRSKAEIKSRVAAMLKLVRMEELAKRRTDQISGGQAQRVALARALAPGPKVLLLDEPLSALDYKLRKEMQIELKRMQHETGITFVFVTHDQEEALTMSDRIAVMSKGRVLQVGSPWDIYDKPADRFVADFIGETNFLTASVLGIENGLARVRLKSGAEIVATLAEGVSPKGEATIVVRPEHARAVTSGGQVAGAVENVVYFGTDTHIHVRLDAGDIFMVRQQNRRTQSCGFEVGDRVGIEIASDAAQVLRD
ncbi:spermidine/putrescine ABC transporter ATPase subunit [Ancylobacter novellus DSM 506]|uniref:Spermidine/putrescine import ATP-binding protein PotA n=1 Tax=Ancylobacter novellus (strain ATCC 8093 / DSM 506 / JCM 20403 / CCM 1077 / IAM 12100 / NBRC 12443 / NCIMB 10456) TaxID=639283 RepID=D7A0R8_ANCN5|nr:ABC transporter ATP-binding protein [Ancylobacter novellus]ADH91389.1 spermidine/putrescine ABC transporter ATPase subunit [Ancylobacter novellus DSM 506]